MQSCGVGIAVQMRHGFVQRVPALHPFGAVAKIRYRRFFCKIATLFASNHDTSGLAFPTASLRFPKSDRLLEAKFGLGFGADQGREFGLKQDLVAPGVFVDTGDQRGLHDRRRANDDEHTAADAQMLFYGLASGR